MPASQPTTTSTTASDVWLRGGAAAAALGVAASLYVLSVSLGDGPETIAGCGGADGGCAHVLQTQWSRWFGLPISALGALLYGALCVLCCARPRRWAALATGAAAALLAGAWFVVLQLAVIDEVCAFCMTTHGCGALVAAAVWRARVALPPGGGVRLRRWPVVALAVAGLVVVATGQLLSDAPDTHTLTTGTFRGTAAEKARGHASFFDGALRLDLDALPVLGDRDAEHVVALVFDFTCPSCRRLSRLLVDAQQRYGGAVAVAELVCPINRQCNQHVPTTMKQRGWACELAQLSCAVFLSDRELHRQYTDWLTRAITEVPPKVARKRAIQLVGEEQLDQALADPRVAEMISRAGEVFANLGAGKLPKLLIRGDQVIVGEVHDAEGLFEVLEEELGVVPVGDAE